MAEPANVRLRAVLIVLGYLPFVRLIFRWIAEPPKRLIEPLLDTRALHTVHIIVPLVTGVVLVGVPMLAGWLSRPGYLRLPWRGRVFARPLGKIVWTFLAVFAVWLVAEVTVRIVDNVRGRGGKTVYYGPGPDLASFHRWLQEAPTPGTLNVNDERFRGPAITEETPPDTVRLFTLGGAGTFLADLPYEKTYPARLASRLTPPTPGGSVLVYNGAYKTWTSQHSLIWYMGRVQDFHPAVVTLMHGPLDLVYGFYNPKTSRKPFDRGYGHNYGPLAHLVKSRYVPGARMSILDHSRVFWYLRRKWRFAVHGEAEPAVDNLRNPPPDSQPPGRFPSLWCYRRNVRTLSTLLTIHGVQFVLITHPNNMPAEERQRAAVVRERFGVLSDFQGDRPITGRTFVEGLDAFNEATRELAQSLDVPLVDLDRALSGHEEYFADPWMFNARGSEEAARLIAEVLQPLVGRRRATTDSRPAAP